MALTQTERRGGIPQRGQEGRRAGGGRQSLQCRARPAYPHWGAGAVPRLSVDTNHRVILFILSGCNNRVHLTPGDGSLLGRVQDLLPLCHATLSLLLFEALPLLHSNGIQKGEGRGAWSEVQMLCIFGRESLSYHPPFPSLLPPPERRYTPRS